MKKNCSINSVNKSLSTRRLPALNSRVLTDPFTSWPSDWSCYSLLGSGIWSLRSKELEVQSRKSEVRSLIFHLPRVRLRYLSGLGVCKHFSRLLRLRRIRTGNHFSLFTIHYSLLIAIRITLNSPPPPSWQP